MESLNSFLDMITTGPPKLAVLGCGCSVATEPVAEISDFWNITHVRKCYTVRAYMLGPLSYPESMHDCSYTKVSANNGCEKRGMVLQLDNQVTTAFLVAQLTGI